MQIAILVLYIINMLLLLTYSMHMFQLNSYFFKKHSIWIKKNILKIFFELFFVVIAYLFFYYRFDIVSLIILIVSCIYNFPKGKAKVHFNITARVKRMFVTEAILIIATFFIPCDNILKAFVLNLISPFICLIANFINNPIEKMIQRYYINDAKKILNDMPNLIVVGVTGSYGKTSVKNFLVKTLSSKYNVLATPKNYNTTMGVVKTIRENLKPIHQVFVCEMGATKPNDIKEICDIVKPKFGVITAIGPQHLESFKSIDNIIKTKFELADSVSKNNGTIFLNYNNEYIANHVKYDHSVSYGVNNSVFDYNAFDLKSTSNGLTFKVHDNEQNEDVEFKTSLIGKHNIVNLVGAISVANKLGISFKKIVPKVKEISNVEHRLQLITRGNMTIIDDAYNSNPISSKSALDTLAEFDGTKIIVTPGLIDLGESEEKYNFEFGEYMINKCDYIFLVGDKHTKPIFEGAVSKNFDKDKIFTVLSPQEALRKIAELNFFKSVVLLENDLPDNYN